MIEEQQYRRVLAENEAHDFLGRSGELDRLATLAMGNGSAVVAGAPGVGVTELLKQTYDRLFFEPTEVIPFYFALNFSGETAEQTARRFLHQFLLQTVAFRRADGSILNWFPDMCELAELSIPSDGHWVDRLVSKFTAAQPECDDDSLIKTCLGGPIRAMASGARVFVMVDNAHAASHSSATARILQEMAEIYPSSGVPYVLAGARRFSFDLLERERIAVKPVDFGCLAEIVDRCAQRYRIRVTDETRDLIANQFGSNIGFIRFMFQAAAEKNEQFESFMQVEKAYAQEIFGGRIRRYYDALIESIAPDEGLQKSIIGLLDVAVTLGIKQLSIESWLKHLAVSEEAFSKIIGLLNVHELIRLTGSRVEAPDGDHVLLDYVTSRFRLEVAGESRAALFGECVSNYLKRAPRIMAAYYRRLASLGLRELLAAFSLQRIPLGLLDYGIYADKYKGLPDKEVRDALDSEERTIQLPQIVYTAFAADLYKPIGELAEKERSVIALGFQEGRYSDEDEVVWVAVEIESKLEASRDVAEFWCDRLEMVALMCNFGQFRMWIIAREGFTPDAIELIRQRGAFASSRRQVEYLRMWVAEVPPAQNGNGADEYEVVVPMDAESEMIAANTLEEIARRHNVSAKAINQMKTALLEASINAAEHSLSPDRRIRQKFRVEKDRFTITISNRGLRLVDEKQEGMRPIPENESSQRRGWGLRLIERLMDEVRIEHTDDGTSISMTKILGGETAA